MSHLLLISLGPVQDFIAAARRFRDLWFGSWLLSELSKAVAEAIAEREGLEALIFPAPEKLADLAPGSELSVANKVLAHVKGAPALIAEHARQALVARLERLAHEAFAELRHQPGFDLELALRQVRELPEFFYAAVPVEGDYDRARRQVEGLMAARKNTRCFASVEWGSSRPKSSLDGQREAVVDAERLRALSEERLHRDYGLRKAENLCGVGFLKRHGGESMSIPSTTHMAALGSLERCQAEQVLAEVEPLIATLRELGLKERDVVQRGAAHPKLGRLNGQVLFENRLQELLDETSAQLSEAREAVRHFLRRSGIRHVQPYYALIYADGDHMGKAIDAIGDAGRHRAFSQALSRFAEQASQIVARHEGCLVYAGGDDVIALLPVHTAIACSYQLAEAFKQLLTDFAPPGGLAPTLTVGLAVAHQLDPAGDTLALARRAEKEAKTLRNALCLLVNKRSGSEQIVPPDHWEALIPRLEAWQRFLREDCLPDGAAYELRTLASQLDDPAAQRQEAKRILGRKRIAGRAPLDGDTLQTLVSAISEHRGVATLAEELVAARLFAGLGVR